MLPFHSQPRQPGKSFSSQSDQDFEQTIKPSPLSKMSQPSEQEIPARKYTYYHAGPLFTIGDLHTNTLLSQEITSLSGGKYIPVLPQDTEQRGHVTPHNIRDKDIRALLSCDLALFTYDGTELDSGTVVEFMIAKFADIPAVILRTDFRGGGDQKGSDGSVGQPWNLMCSFWPRTESVVVDSMTCYKANMSHALAQGEDMQAACQWAGEKGIRSTAEKCVEAMNRALQEPSRMPKELREHVYQWIALMPGFAEGQNEQDVQAMLQALQRKEQKGVFG